MRRLSLATLLVLLAARASSAESIVLAKSGDAYVSRDAEASTWTIGMASLAFTVSLAPGTLQAVELRSPKLTAPLAIVPGPATVIFVNGRSVTLDQADFDTFRAVEKTDGVSLDLVFTSRTHGVRVTRSYAVYARSPVVEAWTRFEALSSPATIQGLNAWQLTVPAGTVRTVTGLLGDDADNSNVNVSRQFTIERQEVAAGRRLDLGSTGRSSEEALPWFAIERSDAVFFGGLMWSGNWSLSIERTGSSLKTTLGVPGAVTTATADRAVETPHGFFGITRQ